jgi:hypothetical protein
VPALIGAVLAHVIAALVVFVIGAIFGASTTNFVRRSAPAYGLEGGKNALEMWLWFGYFTIIPAVLVSLIGAGVACGIWLIICPRAQTKCPGPGDK